ncbi:nuclear transcription factor Y subunit beta-like isoform X1 [Polypterus senegalus]|uniref:nuclear transcription factor Y subunit beta-like isoform X1 n=1 Tax=Polypterus senegalus TaxID=55291 RepID=UPI0019633582|nr:nuclear transcription factor Y subunit beta-like isoform X1 [Polypterus senegalus]
MMESDTMEVLEELVERGLQLQKKRHQLKKQEQNLLKGDQTLKTHKQQQWEDEQRTRELEQHLTNLNLQFQEPFSQGLEVMQKISMEIRNCLENLHQELMGNQQEWEKECRQWEEDQQQWEEDWQMEEMNQNSIKMQLDLQGKPEMVFKKEDGTKSVNNCCKFCI